MNYKMVERDRFQILGVNREFTFVNGENLRGIPKMWDELNTDGTSDSIAMLINGEIDGLLGVCIPKSENSMDYWIAAEYEGDVPEKFVSMEIPAAKWVVFEVHGAMPDAIQKTWERIFSEWFPSSEYRPGGGPQLEVYPQGNTSSPDYYSEIWVPIV
jgi:AraC family transcriptional regulator